MCCYTRRLLDRNLLTVFVCFWFENWRPRVLKNIRHGGQSSSILSKMAAEPAREWSDEQLKSDDLPKKDIIKFIQDNAAHSVRSSHSFPPFFLLNTWNN